MWASQYPKPAEGAGRQQDWPMPQKDRSNVMNDETALCKPPTVVADDSDEKAIRIFNAEIIVSPLRVILVTVVTRI